MFSKGRWITLAMLLMLASLTFAMLWIYQVEPSICNGCGVCIPYCTSGALTMVGNKAVIDPDECTACAACSTNCIRGAIHKVWYEGIPGDETAGRLTFGPNPTAGSVFVTGAVTGSVVEVFDLSGRLVASAFVSSDGEAAVELSGLASGNYRIRIGDHELQVLTLIR
ncbi:MAG: T9SS type A sorting domain-containing protein [Candidatus Aegiribacteria sp.]|nr:T9SS type A sorting domain-containing protein [Candidatus Aegiribacteria sp.]